MIRKQCGVIFLSLLSLSLAAWSGALRAEDAARFDIRSIRLEGNTLLSPDEVQEILKPYIGPNKDFGSLQEALEAVQAAYRRQGYTLVTPWLPEQTVERGEIVVRVLEPRLGAIRTEGLSRYSEEAILRTLPALKTGESPRVDEISQNLRLANENTGRRIAVRFAAPEKQGELEAQVRVTEASPWKMTLGADRTGDRATGEYRMSTTIQHNNLFDRDHSALLQYITSPGHYAKVHTWVGAYRIPFYALGGSLDLFAAHSDIDSSNAVTQVAGAQLTGKGAIAGVRYTHNLPKLGLWSQKLIAGIDWRRYQNDVRLGGGAWDNDYVAMPLSLTWGVSRSDDLFSFDASAGIVHNLPWGGKNGQSDYDRSRASAETRYTLARFALSGTYRLENDVLLRGALNGQFSSDRLIPGEQIGMGGGSSVRAYREREEAWDRGASVSFEAYTPELARYWNESRFSLRLLGFYDQGAGSNRKPRAGEANNHSLRSAGVGLRLSAGENLNLSLDLAQALKSALARDTDKGDWRVHFRANLSF